jgi:hypothetical protein
MPTKTGIGFSTKTDSFIAGKEAAGIAITAIQNDTPNLVLCFCSDKHEPHEFLAGVRSQTGNAPLVGGPAFGVFTNNNLGYEGYEANVTVIKSDSIFFEIFTQGELNKDEYIAGAALADQINNHKKGNERGLLLFYDSVRQSNPPMLNFATPLVKAIEERIDLSIACAGAGLLSNMMLSNCFQFYNDQVLKQHVLAVVVRGNCNFYTSIIHGCQPASSYKKVTRAEGPVIYEIENRSAVQVVEELLGSDTIQWDQFAFFVTFGLNKGDKFGDFREEDYANRLCLAVDKEQQSIVMFEPDIQTGDEVQLMTRSISLDYVKQSITNLQRKAEGHKPLLYFYINCGGRAKPYAGGELEDVEEFQKVIGDTVPFSGFYSGVEIANVANHLQPLDWTGVLCLLTED